MEVTNETKKLIDEVKKHVINNLTDENVHILSKLSEIGDINGEEFDFHAIDDTLRVLQNHIFSDMTNEGVSTRVSLYEVHASRLLVENVEQLTSNYNRILNNLRSTYPDFNLVRSSHNPFFGYDAYVPCDLKRCNDDEVEEQTIADIPSHMITQEEVEEEQDVYREFYAKEFEDTFQAKAKTVSEAGIHILPVGLRTMFSFKYYTGNGYKALNALLRSDRTANININDMVDKFAKFAQTMILPFYTGRDMVLYRGDGQTVSSDSLTTRGLYSTSLFVGTVGGFAGDGGRILKINVPSGTPFIPALLHRADEGEIVLLPGTVLQKKNEMTLGEGHFVEYTVVENPPKFDDYEEVQIMRNTIPDKLSTHLGSSRLNKAMKEWKNKLPVTRGEATDKEIQRFTINLVNSKYGGDW